MTACPTVCVGFGEVRRIGVNVEDHVGGMKTDGGIGMSRKVIEELFAFFHCGFCASGLFTSNSTEGHEYSEVNGMGVIQDAANDALHLFDVFFGEGRRRVGLDWALCSAAVLLWLRIVGAMLGASGGCMLVSLELLDNVSGH